MRRVGLWSALSLGKLRNEFKCDDVSEATADLLGQISLKSLRSESEMSPEQISDLLWSSSQHVLGAGGGEGRKDLIAANIKGRCDHHVNEKNERVSTVRAADVMLGVWKWHGTKSRLSAASCNSLGLPAPDSIVLTAPTCACAVSLHESLHAGLLKCISSNFLCKSPFPAWASWLRIRNVAGFPPAPRSVNPPEPFNSEWRSAFLTAFLGRWARVNIFRLKRTWKRCCSLRRLVITPSTARCPSPLWAAVCCADETFYPLTVITQSWLQSASHTWSKQSSDAEAAPPLTA